MSMDNLIIYISYIILLTHTDSVLQSYKYSYMIYVYIASVTSRNSPLALLCMRSRATLV
jgi:hypothetical protein